MLIPTKGNPIKMLKIVTKFIFGLLKYSQTNELGNVLDHNRHSELDSKPQRIMRLVILVN